MDFIFLAILFGIVSGYIVFTCIYKKLCYNKPIFPQLDFDYKILEKEITYKYLSKEDMQYEKRFKLKALKNDLNKYLDKYHWTGSGKVLIKSIIKDHKVFTTIRDDTYQEYEVHFRRVLNKGNEITSGIIMYLSDPEKRAVPFLACTVNEPTEKLTINVLINKNLKVDRIITEIKPHGKSVKVFESKEARFEESGEYYKYTWEIVKPKLLFRYIAKWQFE